MKAAGTYAYLPAGARRASRKAHARQLRTPERKKTRLCLALAGAGAFLALAILAATGMRTDLISQARALTVEELALQAEQARRTASLSRRESRYAPLPVPAVTIYPGQVIDASMLRTRPWPKDRAAGFVDDARAIIGRMAVRTLVRNRPIPAAALSAPYVVRKGKTVRLIFREGGLEITALATALEDAAAGRLVAVRNVDSGRTVYGIAQPDGTVLVKKP